MFVLACVIVIFFSCGQDALNWSVARQLARKYHRPFAVALAAVKGISVEELHRRWREMVIGVFIGLVVTLLLVLSQ
ncbi:MAG: hypothetical protein LV481_03150 [Methylacidiphilales bacterium]|nr:hypothetical protein [Candidatus Methylacidiphilales bacterium]